MKLNKEKVKQILLSCLAFFLIGLGYFNYNNQISVLSKNQETIEVSADYNEINLGDVELVNSDIVPNDEIENEIKENNIENNIEENDFENDYFEETRIERNRMYSEMLETYQKLLESEDVPAEQKSIATQEITNITNIKKSIMISENLIKNKGFEDAIILVNSNNVNIIVKSSKLNKEEISKIQNIVARELEVDFSNISISNK